MSAIWIIYLADVVGGLQVMCGFLAGGCAFFFLINWIAQGPFYPEDWKKVISAAKIIGPIVTLLAFIALLIPSKQTIYMMAAAKVGEEIVQAPETKEIGSKVLKLINEKLDEQLEKKK